MRRYDSYKDSGVEWIGEIPNSWGLRKGSTIGKFSKGNGIKKDEVREVGLPCIRYGEIYTKYNHKIETVETFIEDGVTNVKVGKGTLFMTGSGELLEDIGKCVVYVGDEVIYVGGDIIILHPHPNMNSEFLSYQINSECIRIQRELHGRGGIIVHIYSKNFKDMWFPIPPLSEQKQIVSFLDTKTSLIDSLIEKTQQKIELLKEKRTSLINEVVTKGLNPNVEMKDSGVEWIGEIPSHWTTPKLSFYCEVKDGTHSTPTYVDEGYPLVTQKDITKGKLEFSKTKNISKEDYDEINKRSNVVYGDIIMSMIGSIGNPTIVDTEIPFSIKNVCLFKTSESNELTNYIHYFLNSSVLMTELELKSRGGVQGFVSLDVLRNITFIKPPLSEQQQIVEYLDEQTQLIDKTISIEERRIELLKEYRQSLISEVVTGKVKVVN